MHVAGPTRRLLVPSWSLSSWSKLSRNVSTPHWICPRSRVFFGGVRWRGDRAATAALVEKQSKEMMNLINEKRSEFMLAESLYIDDEYQTSELMPYPSQPPAPQPPGVAKTDIYHDPLIFADIDQIAISVWAWFHLILSIEF